MEGIPDWRKRRLLRDDVESSLGGSLTRGTRTRTQKGAGGNSKEAARAKARETEGKSERRQGCQRLGRIEHHGKKTPMPASEVGDGLGVGRSTEWKACSMRSAEAVRTSWNVRSPSHTARRPETPRSVHPAQVGRESWECARCGCSKSFEWQTSVGHIACHGRRTVERSVGGESRDTSWTEARSLSDEGHGRAEGETVCGCALLNSLAQTTCRLRFAGSWTRRKALSGHGSSGFHRHGDTESSGSWVKRFRVIIPKGSVTRGERIGR